jgi:protein arginine kinase activator
MLCQECRRNEANIHIVKQVGGKQTELNLCEACARKMDELDFSFEPQFSLHKLFAAMLNQSLRDNREAASAAGVQCPTCGLTFAQFSQIGRLGCSDCFKAFDSRLKPLLRRIHAGCAHNGKVPVKVQSRVKAIRQIDLLKDDLQVKIQNEAFEEAAVLRDQIRSLELKMREATDLHQAQPEPGDAELSDKEPDKGEDN